MKSFSKLKRWAAAGVLLGVSALAAAQRTGSAYAANEKWFITGAVGVHGYVGDADKDRTFGDRISVGAEVGAGKWFTPLIGARLMVGGMHANGNRVEGSGESWNFVHIHADALLDLNTLLKGADEERVYSCIPLMGIGMAVAPYDGTRSTVAFSLGILNRIRLAEQLDLNIEVKGTIVGDKLDGEVTGSRGEGSAALTVGLAYTF